MGQVVRARDEEEERRCKYSWSQLGSWFKQRSKDRGHQSDVITGLSFPVVLSDMHGYISNCVF